MSEAGYGADVDEIVGAAVDQGKSAPVAQLYVERAAGRGDWSFLDRLSGLLKRSADGREVLYAVIDALASPAQRTRLHDVLRQHGDEIRQSHRGWAKATGSLVSVRDYAAATTWGADWESAQAR